MAPMIAASGLPAMLLIASPPQRQQCVLVVSLAAILLGVWAYAVWNFELLPAFAVLAAAIIWRFLISPGNLDHPDSEVRFRRVSLFASLALLGLGMLALSQGSQSALLPSAELADVSDRVAVAVVAPIWLVYCAARALRRPIQIRWAQDGFARSSPLPGPHGCGRGIRSRATMAPGKPVSRQVRTRAETPSPASLFHGDRVLPPSDRE